MRLIALQLVMLLAALGGSSQAAGGKPCEELKAEIAAKLDQAGVKAYELQVVAADQAGDAKVVGSCELGSKKITYTVRKP